ncbi:hypothetical protein OG21DRAFT_960110 [Imleria badia]|nr:hypothetical protein OG21DRAFT_960110 [Imleria badia]
MVGLLCLVRKLTLEHAVECRQKPILMERRVSLPVYHHIFLSFSAGTVVTRHPRFSGFFAPLRLISYGSSSKFTLDLSGVASFFGGEEAISAIATVHLYEGRRWLGWYNCPGTFSFAGRFARMANPRVWDGLFSPRSPPPILLGLGLDGKTGPNYIAALSGTTVHTGHLAHLTIKQSKELREVMVPGRLTNPIDVVYLVMGPVDYNAPIKRLPLPYGLTGLTPITISVVTCVMCALVYDWCSFSMILLGMVSSGLATFVAGRGRLMMKKSVRNSVTDPPPGILLGEDSVVVVKGEEGGVNAITRARFELDTELGTKERFRRGLRQSYSAIGVVCLFLFTTQFILQLLLVPQGTLFGQIMFIISLSASWTYNYYLSSFDTEKIQAKLLFKALGNPQMHRFCVGTRMTMAVLVCLLLFNDVRDSSAEEGQDRRLGILNACLPHVNTTRGVWKKWMDKVVEQLMSADDMSLSRLTVDEKGEDACLSETERALLFTLLGDARAAFEWYFDNWAMYSTSSIGSKNLGMG